MTSKEQPANAQSSTPASDAVASVETRWGKFPLPPWWVMLLTLLMVPTLIFGPMILAAGWAVGWRWRSLGQEPPADARFLISLGGAISQAIFWPMIFYFSLTNQTLKKQMLQSLLAGGGGVIKAGSKAGTRIRKYWRGDDQAFPKKQQEEDQSEE